MSIIRESSILGDKEYNNVYLKNFKASEGLQE
jgi:hypothetical protein